ncbi:MAG: patatin-like phospholipase family protein [Pseudomonadales bacterium]
MSRLRIVGWSVLLTLCFVVLGCAARDCPLCKDQAAALTDGGPKENCGDPFDGLAIERLSNTVTDEGSADILLLSGGGSRGSFAAGILNGWKDSPPFDMVTGVSTGAIMATWAYLGRDHKTKPYEMLRQTYAGHITAKQIRKRRWLFPLVDSKYSLAPLKKMFLKILPTEMIIEVGRVYKKYGRQLWIGSTNLETGQFCHWNLGQRALNAAEAYDRGDEKTLADEVDMYHKLIIASSANPTVFQSVDIYGYTHVDGGVSETIYVERINDIVDEVLRVREANVDKPLNVYAVVNGRLINSQKCVGKNIYSLATRSISLLSKSATRGNLDRIKTIVDEGLQGRSWNYYTGWLPAEKKLDAPDVFSEASMRALFKYGEDWIANQDRWCKGIPGAENDQPNCKLPEVGRLNCS